MNKPRLISLAEAAEICGCSASRLRRLAATGQLEGAEKIGRNWVIPREKAETLQPVSQGWKGYWELKGARH